MITPIKNFFKHVTLLDPQYSLNVVIVLLLSVVSFYTSFDGLRHYMFGQNPQEASWSLLILLGFLVFLIQLLLIVALSRLTQRISFSNKISMMFLYFIAMGFSVFLSYSYWYQAIQADNYAYDNFNVQLDDSLSDVGIYQETFLKIKKMAEELAEYSQDTATLEKRKGGTCGDNSAPGAGPRQSLRNSEELLFTLMSNDILLLSDKVTQKINSLDNIRYGYSPDSDVKKLQNDMNIVIADVNRYKQNLDLVKAKTVLKAHSGEARSALSVVHNGGNRTVSCPDATITEKSQLLLTRIQDLPVLKNIRLFDSQNDREVMERALKVFTVIPSTVKGIFFPPDAVAAVAEEKSAEAVKSSDFTPLVLGVMIDLVIFFVGYGNGKYTQQRNYLSGKYHGQHFSVNDAIKINHVFKIKELRENLQWYHHQLGKKHLIIIPSDNYRQSENLNKRNLVSLMESLLANRRVALEALRVPFDTLPENMHRRFADLPKDTLFEFYFATEEQWFDLLQSLEADEILTSEKIDTQEYVLSALEHSEARKDKASRRTPLFPFMKRAQRTDSTDIEQKKRRDLTLEEKAIQDKVLAEEASKNSGDKAEAPKVNQTKSKGINLTKTNKTDVKDGEDVKPEDVKAKDVKAKDVKPEDVKAKDAKAKDAKAKDAKAKDAKAKDAKAEDAKAKDAKAKDAKAKDAKAKDAKAKDAKAKDAKAKDAKAEDAKAEDAKAEDAKAKDAKAKDAKIEEVKSKETSKETQATEPKQEEIKPIDSKQNSIKSKEIHESFTTSLDKDDRK